MTAPALPDRCPNPATHGVQLEPGQGFYSACEACIAKARDAYPETVQVRPLRSAEQGRGCVVPGINA